MSEQYIPEYIYKMVHIDNMDYVLSTGLCSPLHPQAAMNYIEIGDPLLARERSGMRIPAVSGGIMPEYVTFYFQGRMPMLWTMIHADELFLQQHEKSEAGQPPRFESRSTVQRHQREIVFVACRLNKVAEAFTDWCFTDGHASSPRTKFYNDLADLPHLDWKLIRRQDTRHDNESERRRQAEFLFKGLLPVAYIDHLTIRYPEQRQRLEELLQTKGLSIPVVVDTYPTLFFSEEGKPLSELMPVVAPTVPIGEDAGEQILEMMECHDRLFALQGRHVAPDASFAGDTWDGKQEQQQILDKLEEQHERLQEEFGSGR